MGLIRDLGRYAWRKYISDGVSASGFNKPDTIDIFPFVDAIDDQIALLRNLIAVGFQLKAPVVAASTTNVTLSSMSNGASFGGVTLATGQRFATVGQTSASENGIWVAQASGPPVRAADADTALEVLGMMFFVSSGSNAGKVYVGTATLPLVLGTTALPFVVILDMSSLNATLAGKADQSDLDQANVAIANRALLVDFDETAGVELLDPDYLKPVVAEDGTIVGGVRHDGFVEWNDARPLLDPEFAKVWVDEDGKVLFGVRHDFSFFGYGISGGASVETQDSIVVETDGQIVVYRDGRRSPITFNDSNSNPSISGDYVFYYTDTGAAIVKNREEIKCDTSLDGAVTLLDHIAMMGQSFIPGRSPAVHTSDVRAGRAVMFDTGMTPSNSAVMPPESVQSLVNLRGFDGGNEGPGIALGWSMTAGDGIAATAAALISAHGVGGQSYAQLKKGTTPYANAMAAIKRARVIASRAGVAFSSRVMVWIQGEANRANSKATYKSYLLELQADVTTDINHLTGETGEVLVCTDQISNWTAYGETASEVPFAQLEAALQNPTKIICVGPKYFLQTESDGIHISPARSAILGSYHGRAIKKHRTFLAGTPGAQPWRPLHCVSASRSGAVVTLVMNVPVGPLAFDTSAVSNPGNYGFRWFQTGGTARTISSVAISGSNIVITLSGDPGSPSASGIGIADVGTAGAFGGPTTGPRCCLRDSAADTDIDGNVMRNWACHQLVTL